jgi:hypothetical protein
LICLAGISPDQEWHLNVLLVRRLLARPKAVGAQVVAIVCGVDDVGGVKLSDCLKLLDCGKICRVAAAAAVWWAL